MRQSSFNNNQPTLFLVPTPIGNLMDMTFRSVETLKTVDCIFAEDTRVSGILLKHFEINTPLRSYHEHNKSKAGEIILEYLNNNQNVAIISDAGMPIISDPGFDIAREIIQQGYNVVALPGANAALTALVASGITPHPFTFYGFLDHKDTKKRKELEDLKSNKETLIFYESPHRIVKTLELILEVFGDRNIVLARELTKKFEEFLRGPVSSIIPVADDLKGEMVLIVEGNKEEQTFEHLSIIEHINLYIKEGLSDKESIKKVAKERNLPKNEVYREYHK